MDEHGLTMRQRNTVSENAGHIDDGWRPAPPPDAMAGVWRQYLEIHEWRGSFPLKVPGKDKKTVLTKFVPHQMDLLMIEAWSHITGTRIGTFELDIFSKLEAAFWRAYHGKTAQAAEEGQFLDTKKIAQRLRMIGSAKDKKKDAGMRTIEVKPRR